MRKSHTLGVLGLHIYPLSRRPSSGKKLEVVGGQWEGSKSPIGSCDWKPCGSRRNVDNNSVHADERKQGWRKRSKRRE